MNNRTISLNEFLFEADDKLLASLSEADLTKISSGTLTEEELNELFGFTRKKTLIKKIMDRDPQADEEELKVLSKSALKKMLKDAQEEAGEDTRGFFAKTVDRIKGIGDIGMFSNKAGTLLGGTETFDIKKRNQLKDDAKRQAEKWMAAIEYPPITDLYSELVASEFPNKADKGGFKGEASKFQKVYDDVVEAHKAEQLDTKTANTIIAVLRGVVIYFQDFAMNDKYYYKENKDLSLADLLFEEVEDQEEEEKIGRGEGDVSSNFEAAYGYGFPLGLIATGAAMMTLGFAAETPFVQGMMEGMKDVTTTTIPGGTVSSSVTNAIGLGEVKPNEGIIRVVRRMVPGAEKFGLSGGPSIGDIFGGGKNKMVLKLIKASMMSSTGPGAMDALVASNADPATAFVSGATSGRGRVGEELFGINAGEFEGSVTSSITENLPDTTKITEDDTFRNKLLNGLMKWAGPALKGLGLGFLVAGVASGFLRWKGKGGKKGSGKVRGSRMSVLKVMVDGFKDVGKEEEEDQPPPPPPPEGDIEIAVDLTASGFKIVAKDTETGETEELDLDVEGIVPNLPALVELGITTPDDILNLLSEAFSGELTFKGKKYPDQEGTPGSTQKDFEGYPTLEKLLAALIKRQHPEIGDLTQDMLGDAIKDNAFTLNDLRGDGDDDDDPPVDPPVDPPKPEDRPRLGLVKLDDDGLKLYRTRGNIGDKKYDAAKSQFQAAQDQALTGRDTSPSSEDIETDHVRQRRTPPAATLSYSQMVGRRGVRGKDLKPGIEVDPYFTIDKGAHSDVYAKRRKNKTIKGMGKLSLPGLGKDQKARSEKMLKAVFKKFVTGKKKLTQPQAKQIVRDYIGRGRGGAEFDTETRDKVISILVGYGLVSESASPAKSIVTESKAQVKLDTDTALDRWSQLAGLGKIK
jgi:hypothetical protein